MKVELFDSSIMMKVIRQYRETFPEIPTKNEQIYIDEDAMMYDGYIKPVEELNELFSTLFRFSKYKEPTDIRLAQEPGGTDNLSIQQIAFFVADFLVNEKHHQGLFATMLKNGVIASIVDRLEVLLECGLSVITFEEKMEFREAKIEDAEQLSKLFHCYRQLSVSLDNFEPESESLKWITSRLTDGNCVFLIAVSDGLLLGFVTLYKGFSSISLNNYWVLNDLYVSNNARGLGLGRALMKYAESYAQKTKAKGIELETSLDNVVAQSLYEDLGYLENKKYKRYFKKVQL